jgi:hypothetical protein
MKMYSRQEWGARPPKETTPLPWEKIDALVIHYSAAFTDEFPDYVQRVKGIQNYHMDTQGWNDIAYNYLVARNGDIFTGRGWEVMSAATLHNNDHTQAICFLGADKAGRDDVTDNGRRSISQLIFAAEALAKKKFKITGHRDWVSTDCPGDELYAFVQTQGWEAYRDDSKKEWPPYFFEFAAWYLGEGKYKQYGPKKGPRPTYLPSEYEIHKMVPYWLALRRFLAARKK